MKRFLRILMEALVIMVLLFIGSAYAQKSLPQVPITYSGDTNETIARRARWIESARKQETRSARIEKAMEMLKKGVKSR